MSDNNLWIILLAGGSGSRFGSQKQFKKIAGKSILEWSMQTVESITPNIIVVLPEGVDFKNNSFMHATGGATRSDSVRAGLKEITIEQSGAEIVLIHDAARPLANAELFIKTAEAIKNGADAAVPIIPLTDTINTTDGKVIDRTKLLCLQTPQAFRLDVLREVHSSEPEATDDISLCIQAKKKVKYVDGDTQNLKITEPIDLKIAELLLNERPQGKK